MSSFAKLTSVFERLKAIMMPYARKLDIKSDSPTQFRVYTRHAREKGHPLLFGAVQINVGCVSYHLMPLIVSPALLENASGRLRERMDGRSCFVFAEIDDGRFRELAILTQLAYASFQDRGFA